MTTHLPKAPRLARTLRRSLALALATSVFITAADACSRATWLGPENAVITGRSMDWPYAFNTHFFVFPRGSQNVGFDGPGGLTWESRYGTVVAAGTTTPGGPIDGVFDGMNEMGLGANLLYLAETEWPAPGTDKPLVSWAAWVQYVLSNNATVAEAVAAIESQTVSLVPSNFGPGGAAHPTVHLSLTDPTGDSAVVEFLGGKPVIHHGREFQVMTNSPTFAEQLTLNTYWSRLDGTKVLPGSHQSQDRFVRASYYLDKLPQSTDERQQIAGVLSVMRNVSVPWGEPDPDHPNIAPTYWRTVLDHGRKVYYFESALSPNVVWVNLNDIDFAPESGIRAVTLEGPEGFALMGRINDAFTPADPIRYLTP
jgi:penicillin V acylase-like amidase (Ntn superfamily)